jgi:hypothetical protein
MAGDQHVSATVIGAADYLDRVYATPENPATEKQRKRPASGRHGGRPITRTQLRDRLVGRLLIIRVRNRPE